jgi:hypothetical protein
MARTDVENQWIAAGQPECQASLRSLGARRICRELAVAIADWSGYTSLATTVWLPGKRQVLGEEHGGGTPQCTACAPPNHNRVQSQALEQFGRTGLRGGRGVPGGGREDEERTALQRGRNRYRCSKITCEKH